MADDTVNCQADRADEHILNTFVLERPKELEDLFEIHLDSLTHCSQSSSADHLISWTADARRPLRSQSELVLYKEDSPRACQPCFDPLSVIQLPDDPGRSPP